MDKDEIIKMARQAGFITDGHWAYEFTTFAKLVEDAAFKRWAAQTKLAVQDEREACAKEAEDSDHVVLGRSYHDQLGNAGATAKNIAVAIRARGEA